MNLQKYLVRNAADILALGRRRRLAGLTDRALQLELKASALLGPEGEDLLASWKGSLEEHPIHLEDWQEAGGWSWDDLRVWGVVPQDSHPPHVTGGGL